MKNKSKKMLAEKRQKLMEELGRIGPFLEGSLGRVNRICGNPNCVCRTDPARKHPAVYLTWKEDGKTQSLYVPVGMWEEAERWNQNYRNLKDLLHQISDLQKDILRLR